MWSRMRRIAVQVGDLYMKPCRQTERGMRDKVKDMEEDAWRCGHTSGWSYVDKEEEDWRGGQGLVSGDVLTSR